MPKIVDKENKRYHIIKAAIQVFAKTGYKNTKIVDVAKAAGIGKGTVYEYFTSKDEIFTASFHYFMEKVNELVAKRLYRIFDPLEKLHTYLQVWGELLDSKHQEFLDITLDFWAEGIRNKDSQLALDFAQMYKENHKMIKDILEDCILRNTIEPINTETAASIIIGALDGMLIQWIYDIQKCDIRKTIEDFSNLLMNGLRKRE